MQQEDDKEIQEGSAGLQVKQLQEELARAMDNWKRCAADFENFKKQKERENKELVEFAKEVTVAKLLPTLDTLEQALRHLPELADPQDSPFAAKYRNWQAGASGLVQQLDKVLGEMGVKKIQAVGKKFDPHMHEAVREVDSEQESGLVLEEYQTGFELNGKVIRPSQVAISKGSAAGHQEEK